MTKRAKYVHQEARALRSPRRRRAWAACAVLGGQKRGELADMRLRAEATHGARRPRGALVRVIADSKRDGPALGSTTLARNVYDPASSPRIGKPRELPGAPTS